MYFAHWGISESPFRTNRMPESYFPSPGYEEALARVHFLIDGQKRLGTVMGAGGCGKSLLLQILENQLGGRHAVVRVKLLGMVTDEFLWQIAAGLGASLSTGAQIGAVWQTIGDRLAVNRYQRVKTVFLLDDADNAELDVLTAIGRLAQMEFSIDASLTIVITADVARTRLIGPRLQDLNELRIELEPWLVEETGDFLEKSMGRVGRYAPTFTDQAVGEIHRLSGGVPRRVIQLSELALVGGAARQVHIVDETIVLAVFEEMALYPSAA